MPNPLQTINSSIASYLGLGRQEINQRARFLPNRQDDSGRVAFCLVGVSLTDRRGSSTSLITGKGNSKTAAVVDFATQVRKAWGHGTLRVVPKSGLNHSPHNPRP